MSDPYLGEIRMVGFNYAPVGWALCDGTVMQVTQNEALFALLGATYGGNGSTTFGLPNLLGRMPVHMGSYTPPAPAPAINYPLAGQGGAQQVTLSQAQLPAHTHTASCNPTATAASPSGAFWASPPTSLTAQKTYFNPTGATPPLPGLVAMNANSISYSAGAAVQPHANMPPYLAINFIICLSGLYPVKP